jgi:hypothetical protein
LRLDPKARAETIQDAARQEKTQPHPLTDLLGREERRACPLQRLGVHAMSLISDGDQDAAVHLLCGELHQLPPLAGVDAVVDQIAQRLHESGSRNTQLRIGDAHIDLELDARLVLAALHDLGEELGDAQLLQALASALAGIGGHLVEDAPAALHLLPDQTSVLGGMCEVSASLEVTLQLIGHDSDCGQWRGQLVSGTGRERGHRLKALAAFALFLGYVQLELQLAELTPQTSEEVEQCDGQQGERSQCTGQVELPRLLHLPRREPPASGGSPGSGS